MAFHNLIVILCIVLAVISSPASGKGVHPKIKTGFDFRKGFFTPPSGPHKDTTKIKRPRTPRPPTYDIPTFKPPYPTTSRKGCRMCDKTTIITSQPPGSKKNNYPGHNSHPSQSTVQYLTKYIHYVPTYYNAPQFKYITKYRHSNSRYSNLLTGLAVYNLRRSHRHNHYYYHDHYSRNSYPAFYSTRTEPEDNADCSLKVEEHGQVSHLHIPCEIVSTFAEKYNSQIKVMNTVNITAANCKTANGRSVKGTELNGTLVNATLANGKLTGGRLVSGTVANGILVNCTAVNTTFSLVEPLQMKGQKVSMMGMKCAVEVRTQTMFTSKDVDCGELIHYSKMPEPQPEQRMVPSANTYRIWLNSPPWWLSFLFVV